MGRRELLFVYSYRFELFTSPFVQVWTLDIYISWSQKWHLTCGEELNGEKILRLKQAIICRNFEGVKCNE